MNKADDLEQFAERNALQGLTSYTLNELMAHQEGIQRARSLVGFTKRVESELLSHQLYSDNAYFNWFMDAELTDADVRHFVIQFSVLYNQSILGLMNRMMNAESLGEMRYLKVLLVNELGVRFKDKRSFDKSAYDDEEFLPLELGQGIFNFSFANFELLVEMAKSLGLSYSQLGRRQLGSPTTLALCDSLQRLYGSPSREVSQASGYVMRRWLASGFWKQVIKGLEHYKQRRCSELPLDFFRWYGLFGDQKAGHLQREFEHYYMNYPVDESRFIEVGKEMLEAANQFWDGLNRDRQWLH